MRKPISKQGLMILLVILAGAIVFVEVTFKPTSKTASESLTDLQSIETLRTQFNQDLGQTRLILLAAPT